MADSTPNSAALLAAPQAWEPSTDYKDHVGQTLVQLIRTPDGDSTNTQRYLFIVRTLDDLRSAFDDNGSDVLPSYARRLRPLRLEF